MKARALRRIALGAMALPLVLAAAPSAADLNRNGAGVDPMSVALGSLELSAPNGCVLGYAANVMTTVGEGPESFELQIVDDGAITQIVPLTAPADGGVHLVQGSVTLARFPAQESPGIGAYLVDDGLILDGVDPFFLPCGAPEVPTLAGTGFLTLGAVLVGAALLVLRRPRRAQPSAI